MLVGDYESAFPIPIGQTADDMQGMSVRDWFAGQALAGLIVQVNMPNEVYARMAYGIADSMLHERSSTNDMPHNDSD